MFFSSLNSVCFSRLNSVVSWQAHFLKFAGKLSVQPPRDVLDPILQHALQLAPFFEPFEASLVVQAVADLGAGEQGKALVEALQARHPQGAAPRHPQLSTQSEGFDVWNAASHQVTAQQITTRLTQSSSAADVRRVEQQAGLGVWNHINVSNGHTSISERLTTPRLSTVCRCVSFSYLCGVFFLSGAVEFLPVRVEPASVSHTV